MDYLNFFPQAKHNEINTIRRQKQQWVSQQKKGFLRYRKPLESVAHIHAKWTDFTGDVVRIGQTDGINTTDHNLVEQALKSFMPWRKGPFEVFGTRIDAEWRSERKWNRILPELPDLEGKVIADIGCNNGYYMFRMVPHNPQLVLGFEPHVQHWYCFQTLNGFAEQDNLVVDLLGVEHLHLFPDSFDVIFLMGIIYHRHSPIDVLKDIKTALKEGGTVIIESQALPGDDPVALFPEQTYCKAPGVWFVPTGSCLYNWLVRAGFKQVDLFCSHPMSNQEQRRTEWMNFESYEDFIDNNRTHLTIEGYPAPWRVFLKAM